MLRIIIISILSLFLSAVATANPVETIINDHFPPETANFTGDTYYLDAPQHSLAGNGKHTWGVYVKKYRKLSHQISDSVLLDCSGVSTVLQPGSGAFCNLASSENFIHVKFLEDQFHHGSDVLMIDLGQELI